MGFDKDAKDLIKKLLRVNPLKRLGGGAIGSPYDMDSLKKHPFFKGKSFEGCTKQVPPFSQKETEYIVNKYNK